MPSSSVGDWLKMSYLDGDTWLVYGDAAKVEKAHEAMPGKIVGN